MKELIDAAFLHVDVIGPHVVEGHYDLVGPEGMIILPLTWDQTIQPGWHISMHMWPIEPPNPQPPLAVPPPPPVPLDQRVDEEDEVEVEVEEPDDNTRGSAEGTEDTDSLDYRFTISHRARIANTLSALKRRIFHRRKGRRGSTTSTSSSARSSEILDD